MKSLFSASDNTEIINRINRLTSETKAEWGKMNVSQMLAHVQAPLKVAFGETKPRRSLAGILFGRLAKRRLSSEEPWGRGLPTDRSFIVTNKRDFEDEKKKLIAMVQRFIATGRGVIVSNTHPFFGRMTVNDWDNLMWNHLNHHLNQFGA